MTKRKKATRSAALGGSFLDKLAAWTAIVDEVVQASTVAAARKGCAKAEKLDHIPVDLWNEDDCDGPALTAAHDAWNEKIEARIKALGGRWDLVSEVCNLRDLINDS